MKYISTLVLTLVLMLSNSSFAQSKVAHIDFQTLVSQMPSVLAAQEEVQKLEKDYQTEIDASIKEYQTKLQSYSAEAESQTDVTNQARQQELAGMEQNIQQYRQTAAQDIQKKQSDLLRPIIENVRAKIQQVAKAQGFHYVLDSSPGSSVMMAEGKNLEADVKKALGL